MARNDGWIPQQHGAWAMLVVPLVTGLVQRHREGGLPAWAIPLAATWLVGYFAFNACGLWLKAPARRRARLQLPLLTHASVAAVAGVTTLALGGSVLLAWVPIFLPLLGTALWLTSRHRERALLSGACTVLAACLLCWILVCTTPSAAWQALPGPATWPGLALFGYFFGTVLVVKTLIRERGKAGWVAASIGWQLGWVALASWAATGGWATGDWTRWGWVAFFAVGALRAWALPWFGPRAGRTIRPAQVGALELVLSLVALLLCLG